MADENEITEGDTEPQNISELFDDDSAPEPAEDDSEAVEGEESEKGEEEAEESDQESEEDTESEEGEESEPPSDENESVPRRALLDERRKRQEAEREREELKRRYEPDEEAPDPTDDPQAYEKYLRQKWEKEQWEKTATKSRERMIEKHPDYEEKEQHFMVLAQRDPDLVRQMNEDPDPAAFAYSKAAESLEKQEKAIEERVLERLKKEGKLKDESEEKPKGKSKSASKVSDLTKASGAGNNSEATVKESENPEEVFDDLKY